MMSLTRSLPALAILASLASASTAASQATGAGDAKLSFERQILPILDASCLQCHKASYRDARGRTRKPKSGLRLDGRGWILKGGDNGVAVVPGKPDASPLYELAALDPDDPDIMPAKGDPLTKAQLALLRRWIEEGCDFGSWTGAPGPDEALVKKAQEDAKPAVLSTARTEVWRRLGADLKAPLEQAVKRAAGTKCQVEAIVPGSPLLRVAFVSNEASVGDRDLEKLGALTQHITQLGLAKTRITDVSLRAVAKMKRLTRLDLNRTKVTDEGLKSLAGLRELRYLNLHSTQVTDAGLRVLSSLPALESIFLWNSKVTADGVRALRQKLPRAKISHEIALPDAPRPARGDSSRRRRRK